MPIDPDYLEAKKVVRLASVDGAVMVGPDGRCHAFGVILDGIADESGDRAGDQGSTRQTLSKHGRDSKFNDRRHI